MPGHLDYENRKAPAADPSEWCMSDKPAANQFAKPVCAAHA
jgi:hypothetical protein